MFTQRFLGSSRGKHCKYYLYTLSLEIVNAVESPSRTSTPGKRMGPGSYLDEAGLKYHFAYKEINTTNMLFT